MLKDKNFQTLLLKSNKQSESNAKLLQDTESRLEVQTQQLQNKLETTVCDFRAQKIEIEKQHARDIEDIESNYKSEAVITYEKTQNARIDIEGTHRTKINKLELKYSEAEARAVVSDTLALQREEERLKMERALHQKVQVRL